MVCDVVIGMVVGLIRVVRVVMGLVFACSSGFVGYVSLTLSLLLCSVFSNCLIFVFFLVSPLFYVLLGFCRAT